MKERLGEKIFEQVEKIDPKNCACITGEAKLFTKSVGEKCIMIYMREQMDLLTNFLGLISDLSCQRDLNHYIEVAVWLLGICFFKYFTFTNFLQ